MTNNQNENQNYKKIIDKSIILNNKISSNDLKKIGIYFLIRNNDIVYIGQTKKGIERITKHFKNKDFDSYYFYSCDLKHLDILEALNIMFYKPKYNKSLNDNFFTFNSIKNILKKYFFITATIKKIKFFINISKIKIFYFDNIEYIENKDFEKIYLYFINQKKGE